MLSIRRYPLARAFLHGTAILGLVFAAGASALTAYAAPMTNNLIADAIKITTAGYSGTVDDVVPATTSASDPVITCGASQGMDSVWYTFTPVASGVAAISTVNSQYDTIVAVFKNDPLVLGGLIQMGCNDNASAGIKTSSLSLALRGGVKYYIEVVRKTGTPVSSPDRLNIQYSFTQKVVAWSNPLGKKYDAGDDSLFEFSSGWQPTPWLGAYKDNIYISHNVNNTAVAYFDGGNFDLWYELGPTMGTLAVYVDNVLQVNLGQGNATYVSNMVWNSPVYSDGVHKLTLKHTVGSTKANFDYITVYSFPDVIPPAKITTLTATTGTTSGKITLKWNAVGDDNKVGKATSYEIRYFPHTGVLPNCVFNWATGTSYVVGLPTPAIAGTIQQVTLSGLVPNLRYYFCIAAIDEVGNMGIPSNRATAIATAGVPYGTGTYDDNHPGWTYTGNWRLVTDPDARYNTLHVSHKIDDTADFFFTGKQFVFTYRTGFDGGLMDVYVDGVYLTTIDQLTPFTNRFYYTSPIMVNGPHFVRFVHRTQLEVTVDQIYVWAPVDFGPPDPITDLAAVPGLNNGEVDLTWTATGDDPGGVGKADHYEIRYSPYPITNAVEWDFAEPAAGVFPAPHLAGVVEHMTVIGLTPGAHYYFAVLASDNAFYDVLSNTTDSDVQYTGPYAAGPAFYEDDDPIWSYNGTWRQVAHTSASAGHIHKADNFPPKPSAYFWFTGTKFTLFFQKNAGYGILEVFVDGVKVGAINQYSAVPVWDVYWVSPVFAFGNHVVEFRLAGDRATVDRIRIFP